MFRRSMVFGVGLALTLFSCAILADRPLDNLKQVQRELACVAMPASEVIPAKAVPLLRKYKDRMLECIRSYINNHDWNDVPQLQENLKAFLTDQALLRVTRNESIGTAGPDVFSLGVLCQLGVNTVANRKDTLSVLFGIDIWCGEDDVLAVFRKRGETWQVAMVYESEDYRTIDKAFGGLQFCAIGMDDIFAVAHINPWCTSNWREITVQLVKESAKGLRADVLFSHTETIYLGVDAPIFTLTSFGDGPGACLRFTGEEPKLSGVPVKKSILFRYLDGKVSMVSANQSAPDRQGGAQNGGGATH